MKEERPDKKVKVYWMDEGRFGQQGTLTRKWARRGSRPTAVKQTRYEWMYCYAAVDPDSGDAVGLLLRHVDTAHMNEFLRVMSERLKPDEHAVLVMDNAGWHVSGGLKMPANITPLFLPPYAPELNPIERLWAYIKSHFLSNRAHADYQALLDAGCRAWDALTPELLRTVCAVSWLTPGYQA